MLTCNLTKSTVNEERFSKIVLHSQLSGLSDSTELMYANPLQKASSSLNASVDRVASALYVALAEPASIGFIPSTCMVPDNDRVDDSPDARWPTSHVKVEPSMVAPPVAIMFN